MTGGIVANYHDVTESIKAQQELERTEREYRLLAENLSDVIWTVDANLRYTYLSPSVTRLLGYSVEEATALSMEEATPPNSLQNALRVMGEAAAREGPGANSECRSATLELEMTGKDGSTVWVEHRVTCICDPEGRVTGYLGVSRDGTERREASRQLQQGLQKLERTLNGIVQAIVRTVECRDLHTADHQRRVAQLACAIAEELGFTPEQVQVVRIAGLLHDIGKLSLPQELLNKPGKVTEAEFQLIKTHSQTGYDILKTVEFPWPIADIVVQHHERMNGSGYPSGIKDDKLLMEARILGVADVVEAMNSYRPYRPPLGIDKALGQISRNRAVLYDPRAADACVRLFTEKGFKFED
jgi:PAS domain S-box-containing protein/putative nucleotidyltransferase with HDIG domain